MAHDYVLLVEDNAGDAGLVRLAFEDADGMPELVWVQTVREAVGTLRQRSGCAGVLLDLGLPDAVGLSGLQSLHEHAAGVPVIVLSGNDDDRVGLDAVVAGASDYLVKGHCDAGELRRALLYSRHRKQVETALVRRALHDTLTGLPTRALLHDRLDMALKRAARNALRGALLFVDLDRFKQVNDRHGHAAGDALLKGLAARLVEVVRASDTVARVGGDEFVVLLPEISHDNDSEQVARKLIAAAEEPVHYAGEMLSVSASVGVVEFDGAEVSADELMRRADAAMYEAKRDGKATVRHFD
jgi:diguanylate cyclase (GGDEF)-like protein